MAEKLEMNIEDGFDTAYEKIQTQATNLNEAIDMENREALQRKLQEINSLILEAENFLRNFPRNTDNEAKIDAIERLLEDLEGKREVIRRALDRLPRL